jgi:hypothetical protein
MDLSRLWNPWRRPNATDPRSALADPELRAALDDLERLTRERPELRSPAAVLAGVLMAAFGGPRPASSPRDLADLSDPAIERVLECWSAQRPAHEAELPEVDPAELNRRAHAVASSLAGENPEAAKLLTAIQRDPARIHRWFQLAWRERPEAVESAVRQSGCPPSLAVSILRIVSLALLSDWSAALSRLLAQSGRWSQGHCPCCGAAAALAELRGLEQRRFLRCDRCGGDWHLERVRCPFCLESDHRSLRYLFAEGEENRYRLAVCDACGGRLKWIATLEPLSPPRLLVAQLAMVHLDLIEEPGEIETT